MSRRLPIDGPVSRAPRRLDAWSIALRLLDMAYPPAEVALRLQLIAAVYGSRPACSALLAELLPRSFPLHKTVSLARIPATLA